MTKKPEKREDPWNFLDYEKKKKKNIRKRETGKKWGWRECSYPNFESYNDKIL